MKIEPIGDEESGHAISSTKSKGFTVYQMKSALLAIQRKISAHQMSMLRAHYIHRTLSMRQIATLGGYSNYRAGNAQYAALCGRIARELGFTSPGDQTYTIATVAPERDEKGEHQWRMDDVVVKALEKIGWFGQTSKKKPEPSRPPTPRRVLFARVGSMTYYAGPQIGDEKPIGGGENNKKNTGHEVFNFADFGRKLYGFVRASQGRLNLERIDPTAGQRDILDDVLVVFVAQQKVIGWYRAATVHRTAVEFPSTVAMEMRKRLKQAGTKNFRLEGYRFDCPVQDAVLLPRIERTHKIPGVVKGGFGQSNVCYTYQDSGRRKPARWINEAASYALTYDKENLLKNPNADDQSEEAATMSQEQAAGFQSNVTIRRAVEKFAMKKAHSALAARGYKNLKDTAHFKPYDYMCERDEKKFFVEVKGTQTLGKKLILTRGEVEHIEGHADQCILVLVHSVKVSGKKTIQVSGGKTEVKESWRLRSADLSPVQYAWTVR